jgi:ABC-type multidrug transport system ATPase subunit
LYKFKKGGSTRNNSFFLQVLELTELKPLANALVVSLINDETFDEEKRLAIAAELAANPSVIFIDDPVKGVDSLSALRIIKCLRVSMDLLLPIHDCSIS